MRGGRGKGNVTLIESDESVKNKQRTKGEERMKFVDTSSGNRDNKEEK